MVRKESRHNAGREARICDSFNTAELTPKIIYVHIFDLIMNDGRREAIIASVNRGIKRAAEQYNTFTGGLSELSWGPEYLITVNIAEELSASVKPSYVYLEERMSQTYEPGDEAPETFGSSKRFDVVLRNSKKFPEAVIEVKNRVHGPSKGVKKDLKRLTDHVKPFDSGEQIFELGIFAFYLAYYKEKQGKSPEKRLLETYDDLREVLEELSSEFGLKVDEKLFERPTKYDSPRAVWGGGCFTLEAKRV